MEHANDIFESKSLVAFEPAPNMVPLTKSASSDIESTKGHDIGSFDESKIDSPDLEITPRVTRVSPVFELASVSYGSAQKLGFSQYDASIADSRLKSSADAALALVVSRLDADEALIATHSFSPDSSGCMGVSTRLHVERQSGSKSDFIATDTALLGNSMVDWRGVFRAGLALLSDEYSFRELDDEANPQPPSRAFLQFDSCTVGTGHSTMGFTDTQYSSASISLPLWASVNGLPLWPGALERTIKAARAQDVESTVGVTISRFTLTSQQRSWLERLDATLGSHGRLHAAALSRVRQVFVEHFGEFLRVSPFIEMNLNAQQSNSFKIFASRRATALADIFAKEVLPLHTGAHIVICDESPIPSCRPEVPGHLNLTTALPFSGSLPPLLAKPTLLRELDFLRHHVNSAVRLPTDGMLLGTAQIGGFEREVRLRQADRSRHVYMVGGTGAGKSSLIFNMIMQDVRQGRGVALCDPASDLHELVLRHIPFSRIKDLVIIQPSDASMAVGLNPLDLGENPTPIAVNRLIGDLLEIFDELYDLKLTGGPGLEQLARNSVLLALTAGYDSPSQLDGRPSFNTVVTLLRDKDWREQLLSKVKQSFLGEEMGAEVLGFFRAAEATTGDTSFKNWGPYLTNKLTRFIHNQVLRTLLCSKRSTINFRSIIDRQQILLVDLCKGAIGALDARLIGMLVTKGLLGAALSRFDIPIEKRIPFTYYLDEFQDVVTPEIGTILSQGRKWGLQLVLSHQTRGQLRTNSSRAVMDEILGNVPTQMVFRTSIEEGALLEHGMTPNIDKLMLSQLPDRQVAARMLIDNKVSIPFIFTTQTVTEDRSQAEQTETAALARQASREKYGLGTGSVSLQSLTQTQTPVSLAPSVEDAAAPTSSNELPA